jgi:hypothetical protein
VLDGYIGGVNMRGLGMRGANAFLQYLHLLSGNEASADRFIEAIEPFCDLGAGEELARVTRVTLTTLRQRDSVLAGLYRQYNASGLARTKFDRLAASQLDSEAQRLQGLRTLEDYPPGK